MYDSFEKLLTSEAANKSGSFLTRLLAQNAEHFLQTIKLQNNKKAVLSQR